MYLPAHFAETRLPVLHEAIRAAGAAELVTFDGTGIVASTVPLLLDSAVGPYGVLRGHLARANPQWRSVATDVDALVVFRGPDAYVSPSAYPSKAVDGRVVPTWNFLTIHARGPFVVHDDAAWTERMVRDLTDHHEASRTEPWSVDDAPADYVDGMLRAIVGIEIPLRVLEGKWKLSQNRPAADRTGVVDDLAGRAPALAALMRSQVTPDA